MITTQGQDEQTDGNMGDRKRVYHMHPKRLDQEKKVHACGSTHLASRSRQRA